MHHKKSEVQIGKESSGVSSDYNRTPFHTSSSESNAPHFLSSQDDPVTPTPSTTPILSTPHKRPLMTHIPSLTKSPTFASALHNYQASTAPQFNSHFPATPQFNSHFSSLFSISPSLKTIAVRLFHRLRRFRVHFRFILLLTLPFFWLLVSHPTHSYFLDFFSAFFFSAALLFSLNLALPRLPSIRLFLARSFPVKLVSGCAISRPALPVFWSIGSRPKPEKKANSGCCVEVYNNGDVYEGELHKGKCLGSGVYYYYMSGRYEGDWVDGKYDGYGVETWARGSRYRGQYRQGLRNGFGVYRFYTGDVYAGQWSNGQSHGCGTHTCEDGSRYVGEFKWGVKHGHGHYHFRNGDTYAGEYFADKMHGFGIYKFANGHRYEGAWHEGRRQGLGMYTFRNGETQSGHWQNGILDIPSTQSTTYPVSPIAVYHSKVLNVVQEARRAAEKAYDVTKVDERVNRAVAAANRAANAARVAAIKAVQKQIHQNSNNNHIPIPMV
ncbi:uncharacterized protein LOC117932642 isoform X1 [Vitis riparia]|uniref:uncharacterized protein LOC117932642 isoform X1 n=1 Tax=Vitis riparia TaxID=96939 RepID=UPI00155AB98E|nr:uncharacterized protein LOC117932642 isoform X1 [Vitis riparia]